MKAFLNNKQKVLSGLFVAISLSVSLFLLYSIDFLENDWWHNALLGIGFVCLCFFAALFLVAIHEQITESQGDKSWLKLGGFRNQKVEVIQLQIPHMVSVDYLNKLKKKHFPSYRPDQVMVLSRLSKDNPEESCLVIGLLTF